MSPLVQSLVKVKMASCAAEVLMVVVVCESKSNGCLDSESHCQASRPRRSLKRFRSAFHNQTYSDAVTYRVFFFLLTGTSEKNTLVECTELRKVHYGFQPAQSLVVSSLHEVKSAKTAFTS